MPNPNKTVGAFRKRNPRPTNPKVHDEKMRAVMDAVGKGEMTSSEGANKIREIMNSRWEK